MTITAGTPWLVRPLRSRISPEFLFARLVARLPGLIAGPGWPNRLWSRSMSSARRMRRVVGEVNEELYTTSEDALATAEALGLGRYILAATFGNVHRVRQGHHHGSGSSAVRRRCSDVPVTSVTPAGCAPGPCPGQPRPATKGVPGDEHGVLGPRRLCPAGLPVTAEGIASRLLETTPGLVIYSLYNGYWFWGRPSFEDLRRDLREVTREIRPDWDLAAPGLRGNWDAGDHLMHHPYQQADHMRTVTPLSIQND